MALLEVRDLSVSFGAVCVVRGLSYRLDAGQTLGIVGESGSGKSQAVLALLGLQAAQAKVAGSVRFAERELFGQPERELNRVRGARVGLVLQDAMGSLNPHLSIGTQMAESLICHRGLSRAQALAEAARWLDAVGVANARARLAQYPHEFSGGMRQRVLLASALLCRPELLIADEPTTALDVTVRAQVLLLLSQLVRELRMALILVTHDLDAAARSCERLLIMYAGGAVECGATAEVLARPAHPYTAALLDSRLRLDRPRAERLRAIEGSPPRPAQLPDGCAFHPRCTRVLPICMRQPPPLCSIQGSRACACHAPLISGPM